MDSLPAQPPDSAHTRDAWMWIRNFLAVVLMLDLALGAAVDDAAQPGKGTPPRSALDEIGDVSADEAGRKILFVGDSVLAGDSLAAEVTDWQSETLLRHMQGQVRSSTDLRLATVARNGLLPVDARRVQRELSVLDPDAQIELVVEINLRYFSTSYATQAEPTRDEFAQLSPDAKVHWSQRAKHRVNRSVDALRDWLPVWRHLPRISRSEQVREFLAPASADPRSKLNEAQGRVRAHYREQQVDPEHAQLKALVDIARAAELEQRTVWFFFTPLNDEFVAGLGEQTNVGQRYARVTKAILDAAPTRASVMSLDHPSFVAANFIDHCHLDAQGTRKLAVALLEMLHVSTRGGTASGEGLRQWDPDQTLVGNRSTGFAEGGPWATKFKRPSSLAIHPQTDRVAIADTANHMIRTLHPSSNLVLRWVGSLDTPGLKDGTTDAAQSLAPTSLAWLDDALFFVDGDDHEVLRVVRADRVLTLSHWEDVGGLRKLHANLGRLWGLDAKGTIWELNPETGERTRFYTAVPDGPRSTHMTSSSSDMYVADKGGDIYRVPLSGDHGPERVFENNGKKWIPKGRKRVFPYRFSDIAFAKIVDLEWSSRHKLLLVVDETPDKRKRRKRRPRVTERIHLRALDCDRREVYPWVKPRPYADAQLMYNKPAKAYVSTWHEGDFAFGSDGATLFALERLRSRFVRVSDGLRGAAKSSADHSASTIVKPRQKLSNRLGTKLGDLLATRFDPQGSAQPDARARGYLQSRQVLYVSSSMSAVSDVVGNYSFARRLEGELRTTLGQMMNADVDLYHRFKPGAKLGDLADAVDSAYDAGLRFDVVVVEYQDFKGTFLEELKGEKRQREAFSRILLAATRSGAQVFVLDMSSLVSRLRDGMRAAPKHSAHVLKLAKSMGATVISPSAKLMQAYLLEAPWGNPSWADKNHHGSPWAIDATAKVAGEMMAPYLLDRFRDHAPALDRPLRDVTGVVGLAVADRQTRKHPPAPLPRVPLEFVVRSRDADTGDIFVDLSGVTAPESQLEHEAIAFAAFADAVLRDGFARELDGVRITLARYRSTDEYGEGARLGAEVVFELELRGPKLDDFVERWTELSASATK